MLFFPERNMVFFAIPKTGSTSLEHAFVSTVDPVLRPNAKYRHYNVRQFEQSPYEAIRFRNFARPQRMAVLREPLERMRSWYRYRTRLPRTNPKSTAGVSFGDFIRAYLKEERPAYANLGDQWRFIHSDGGAMGIDHLFASELPDRLAEFVSEKFGVTLNPGRLRVSPAADTALDPSIEAEFRASQKDEYAVYDRIVSLGGYYHAGSVIDRGRSLIGRA